MKTAKTQSIKNAIKTIYYTFTGCTILIFVVLIVYFIGYPLLPFFYNMKDRGYAYSPYNLAYKITVQTFLEISPPNYRFSQEYDLGNTLPSNELNSAISMEDFGAIDESLLSDLEEKATTVQILSASIDGPVVVGITQEDMLRGFWHFPLSSTPNNRGNTVIFGHRFHKIPPDKDTFYNLDKVSVGDKITVTQGANSFNYTVVDTYVVEKNDRTVLQDTGDYRLTLITCTPLWTSDQRLVIVAIQDKVSHAI